MIRYESKDIWSALNTHSTTVSSFTAIICQNSLLHNEDVCYGVYGYSYTSYINRPFSALCWTGDGLKTERHFSLHCQFTRNVKTQQKGERTDILLSLSLPFFLCLFSSLWFLFLFFFFNWHHTITILILIEQFWRKLQGAIFCTFPGNLFTYVTSS